MRKARVEIIPPANPAELPDEMNILPVRIGPYLVKTFYM